MRLVHLAVTGFRGLSRLSLPLENDNVLIGENAWGKSSLLDALTLLLAPDTAPYQFRPHDFYFTPGEQATRLRHLQLVFTFEESSIDERQQPRYRALRSGWHREGRGLYRLRYQASGDLDEQGEVTTRHHFIDLRGEPLSDMDVGEAVATLVRLHPVLRLRDARFNRPWRQESAPAARRDSDALARQIDALTRDLVARPQHLTDGALRQGLLTMQQLLEHYFSLQQPQESQPSARGRDRESRQGWRYLDSLNQTIASADSRSRRLIVLRMFALLVRARGSHRLHPHARPLLLIEDPETRLHPIMLAVAWGLLALLPLQKITTTNSSELLSMVPIEQVCRLVRESGRVAAWRLGPEGISREEARRIVFHICVNRPGALFARCWLLVEGETEVWVVNQLARQCGYHFDAEGVKVIEFAQSGLRPLLKFAQRMGIEWHVLTDGDEAGKKYAATVRSLLQRAEDAERQHLTILPAPDMEHFLYREGFQHVFHQLAQLPDRVPMNARRVISKAIHRSTKPDLAIAVAGAAAERGVASIPPLLRTLFTRVLWLARGRAD
ncbi:ATP-dependent endonuclease [Pantoea sp. 1.19]|uniref:ATP-dependent nuclease n=1 Tax=Pantoea sp. 1.19 TaxID=1925589 RepID=UPI000948D01F|nr:ATP-dependent endonuclease [Pantoea sp. 1.19]